VAGARPDQIAAALARATRGLPGGGEDRPGQVEMARAVHRAIRARRHLVVQAGTGTGKSLAYLVPAILSRQRVVVATATKALQDQLAARDLPFLRERLGVRFSFAILKGRANYLCRQKAAEVVDHRGQPEAPAAGPLGTEVRRLLAWSEGSSTGDRSDLPFEPSSRAWSLLSATSTECPGRYRCPAGDQCFAEGARDRAATADVVVVNTHLYVAHLASDRPLLPEHGLVVFDEAHELEDIATTGLGLEASGAQLRSLARSARPLLGQREAGPAQSVEEAGATLDEVLAPLAGRRLAPGLGEPVTRALALATERVRRLTAALRRPAQGALELDEVPLADPARSRALLLAGSVANALAGVSSPGPDQVAWVEERAGGPPVLRVAPVEVGPLLADRLWGGLTAILTSATIPPGLADRLGLPPGRRDEADVGSPFPYATNALLYCAAHLPDRRRPESGAAAHDELVRLVRAAGGRTLALFTSWHGMQAAAAAVREKVPFRILTQDELPKPALLAAFASEESACLFATMGFWQGVDLPGPTLSLVVIDRLPFPRPDDPVMQARRERVGPGSFRLVDLPRAAMLLAQGAGRLIRSSEDRGVVAVLDRRLARASYRWDLVNALPPMARTRHRSEVEGFLAQALAAGRARGGPGPEEGAGQPAP